VRNAVGVFDVSHMGEIEIRGPEAARLTDYVTTNAVQKLKLGQAHYSGLLYEHGGFVDDILVHKVADDHYFLCVNASNQDKDFEHIVAQNHFDAMVENNGDRYAQIAIQGHKARATLQKLTPVDLGAIKYYWFTDGEVSGTPARIAHTGYTGEDGFEIYVPPADAERMWQLVMDAGAEFGIKPCGLGARNTLRMEAKMALYGHEIDASISPLEADLGWIVKLDKGEFVGRAALLKQKESGVRRKLIGFEMRARGIGRDGYEVFLDGAPAGWVTSGGPAPTLNKNIGMCYLPTEQSVPETSIQVMIRNQPVDAVTVETPFYKRAK
jgi:aminomethyltransferase